MSVLFANKAVQGTVYYIGSEFDNLTVKLFNKINYTRSTCIKRTKIFCRISCKYFITN